MTQHTEKRNYRVVIYPLRPGHFPDIGSISGIPWEPGEEYKACRGLKAKVLTCVGWVEAVEIEYDTETICDFCGHQAEEDEEGPSCCNAAYREWVAQRDTGD